MPRKKQTSHAHFDNKLRKQLYPNQIRFLEALETGHKTVDQIIRQQKLRTEKLGRWLNEELFARRFQRAMRVVEARALSVESIKRLRESRANPAPPNPLDNPPLPTLPETEDPFWQTGMNKRLTELHGSKESVLQKVADCLDENA
jgi:hypothetical protein